MVVKLGIQSFVYGGERKKSSQKPKATPLLDRAVAFSSAVAFGVHVYDAFLDLQQAFHIPHRVLLAGPPSDIEYVGRVALSPPRPPPAKLVRSCAVKSSVESDKSQHNPVASIICIVMCRIMLYYCTVLFLCLTFPPLLYGMSCCLRCTTVELQQYM